ncbi:type II secretion system protein [Synechococcus sp. RS9907]|uniref:type II secretion system protein n=1 Tax=Synechococcus sp. RS9907 TaxID=221350 RepID=UPI00165DBD38|nr:prepilin-type N-terminal cleavage/methylation domain-containing protein [Synechococcus sp. RS9907]
MTTLNSNLRLASLNHNKTESALQKGFTLIELLITVVILGVLSSVAVPGFLAQKDKADIAAANAQGKALMTACKAALQENPVAKVDLNLRDPIPFGKVTWTPTLGTDFGGTNTSNTKLCQSTTSGTTTPQEYLLNASTGEVTDFAATPAKAQDAE